eukprot:650085-Pelagomonas_calceolata.AAC.6
MAKTQQHIFGMLRAWADHTCTWVRAKSKRHTHSRSARSDEWGLRDQMSRAAISLQNPTYAEFKA